MDLSREPAPGSRTRTLLPLKHANQPSNTHIYIYIYISKQPLANNLSQTSPENGLITIDAMERSSTWEISVRDTGVGIDPEIQNKIFEKNSNITTYGTHDEKGTGLGLSLCKEMVEKNK